MLTFDAHLDLSLNALEYNRDLRLPVHEIRRREKGMTDLKGRAAGTTALPEMRQTEMGICVATQLAGCMKGARPMANWMSPEQAYAQTQGQLAWYRAMEDAGQMRQIIDLHGLEEMISLWTDGKPHDDKPIGYILSLSEKNRFKGESNPAYLTRVLQARFGNAPDKTLLPVAVADDSFGANGALATTIVHEIGHMLHRAQKVTSTYFLPLSEGAWSKLSFKLDFESYRLKHAPAGYEDRMGLKILTAQDVKPTLDLFKKTGIATLYGGTSPQEDFAEFYMFTYYPDLKWNIQGRPVFDLKTEMANNPAFKAKRDLIRKLMSLPEPFSLKTRGTVSGEIGPM